MEHFDRVMTAECRSNPHCIHVPPSTDSSPFPFCAHVQRHQETNASPQSHTPLMQSVVPELQNLIILVGSASLVVLCILMDGKWKTIPHLRTKHAQSTCCFEVIGHNSLCKLLSSGSWQNPAVFFTQKPLVPVRRQTFINLHCIQMPL